MKSGESEVASKKSETESETWEIKVISDTSKVANG